MSYANPTFHIALSALLPERSSLPELSRCVVSVAVLVFREDPFRANETGQPDRVFLGPRVMRILEHLGRESGAIEETEEGEGLPRLVDEEEEEEEEEEAEEEEEEEEGCTGGAMDAVDQHSVNSLDTRRNLLGSKAGVIRRGFLTSLEKRRRSQVRAARRHGWALHAGQGTGSPSEFSRGHLQSLVPPLACFGCVAVFLCCQRHSGASQPCAIPQVHALTFSLTPTVRFRNPLPCHRHQPSANWHRLLCQNVRRLDLLRKAL